MHYWDYLESLRQHDQEGLNEGLVTRFAELLSRGHTVADLVGHYGDEFGHLPVETLRQLAVSHRSWQIWRHRKAQHEEVLAAAKLPKIPEPVFAKASSADQLDALVRATRLCPRKDVDSDSDWNSVLAVGIDVWKRCLALVRKEGKIKCDAVDLQNTKNSRYDEYLRRNDEIDSIAAHRWLAMRRGQKDGLLQLVVEYPTASLLEQVGLAKEKLGPHAESRTVESLLEELVTNDLEPWLMSILDENAEAKAIKAAGESLAGLLRNPPAQPRRLASIYLIKPRAPVAVAIVDREGELQTHRVFKAEGDWVDKVADFIEEQGVNQAVVPTSIPSTELLNKLEEKLATGPAEIVCVRAAALAEAKRPLTDPPQRLGPSVASALVLARRALDPIKEWAKVDPVGIGIAEYQHDLDQKKLGAALKEVLELVKLERRSGGSLPKTPSAMPAKAAAIGSKRLNPLVKTLADLRPGMTVDGLITNISHFGAFVNIGLPQEALVHISELSDDFVSNPNEVVRIGQKVRAFILSIDSRRGRISLSMKSQRATERGPRGNDDRPRKQPPKSKSDALSELERLFKK
jgi:transcriptional accessory protein Tex/SPT6